MVQSSVEFQNIFFGKNTTYFSYMQEKWGKMQNNYFVFIKLRVGEYVEYIWDVLRYVLGATYLGALVFNRLSMPLLRKIVYAYIGISGVVAMFY